MSDDPSDRAGTDKARPSVDSLLSCLAHLTAHYGRARSPQAIKGGLAYDESGMTAALFLDAAQRIGLKASLKKKKLAEIDPATLPAVFLLKNRKALVVHKIGKTGYEVYMPEQGKKQRIATEKLAGLYAGEVILTAPQPDFIEPAAQSNKAADRSIRKHWFWGPFWGNTGIYGNVLLAAVLINLFGLTSPLFIMNVYDSVIPNNAIETGWVLGIGALSIFVFDLIIRMLRGYFIDLAGRKIDVLAARRIYDQVMDMKLSERPASSGAFANMLKDFESVREFMTSATVTALVDLPFTLLFLFVIYLIGGPIAYLLGGLILLTILAGLIIQIPLKRLVAKSVRSAEAKHGLLVESIHGLETIKAVGADGRFRARYGRQSAENAYWLQRSRFVSALGVNFATFVQQTASIMIVLMGMYMTQDQTLTMGGLIACVILAGRALSPIGQVANLLARWHQAAAALKTINHVMQKTTDRPPGVEFLNRPQFKGKVAFDRVDFSYPGTERKVLDGISFTINPGEKVGLIGRIGSGKSTVARLVMDLYDPTDGTILFDDTDERQIDPADLRRNIGYIAQDVVLFRGTVRENIIAGLPQATEEDILAAAEKSGTHAFISKHPLGYDAPIGERGEGLSGGQRQAIALARAMLLKPAIYVCDEPTNAMDIQAENAFRQHMAEEAKDKTLILITHRHGLLEMVDRLIILEQGRIVTDGPRDEVLKALSSGMTLKAS